MIDASCMHVLMYVPENVMSRDKAMTRVSPPMYLRRPSAGLGRIFPPWLHNSLILFFLGDPKHDDALSSPPPPPTSHAIFHLINFKITISTNNLPTKPPPLFFLFGSRTTLQYVKIPAITITRQQSI